VIVRPTPISLTPAEIDAEHHPIVQATKPIRVKAWVRFHEATIHPNAVAVEWNDRAVRIEWQMKSGQRQTAWVWASAVERRPSGGG
jgi:hypothetical protein